MKKNVKIDENYYLTTQEVNSNVTVEVAKKQTTSCQLTYPDCSNGIPTMHMGHSLRDVA